MFQKSTIGFRLAAGFGLILLLLGCVSAAAIHALDDSSRRAARLTLELHPKTVSANKMIDRANDIAQRLSEALLLAGEGQRLDLLQQDVLRLREEAHAHLMQLSQGSIGGAEALLLNEVESHRLAYLSKQQSMFEMLAEGRIPEAKRHYFGPLLAAQSSYVDAISRLIEFHTAQMGEGTVTIRQHASDALQRLLTIAVLASLAALAVGVLLQRSITRPLAQAAAIASAMAAPPEGNSELRGPADEATRLLRTIENLSRTLVEEQRALRESEKLYRLLAENSGDVICLHDAACRYTYVSPACQNLLGRTQASMIGQTPLALAHPEDVEAVRAAHSGLCFPGEASRYTITFRTVLPNGEVRWLEVVGRRMTGVSGDAAREIVSVTRDVTARRMAEASVRDSERQLVRSQRQAQLGSWILDLASNSLHCSDEARRLFGIDHAKVADLDLMLSRVHAEDRSEVGRAWLAARASGNYESEHRIDVNGVLRWVRERGEVENGQSGVPLRVVGTTQDISDLKSKELELLRSRRLLRELAERREQVREAERGRIAREIHDELGQHLTTLRMDAGLLRLRYGHLDEGIGAGVALLKETLDNTIKLVRSLSASLRPGILDQGLVVAAEWMLAEFAGRSGIHCMLDVGECDITLPEPLATAAFRIIQESLTNVARHSGAQNVTVRIALQSERLHLGVEDDGRGFAFSGRTDSGSLGLLGMQERALMLGGELEIISRPGSGTRIRASLPLVHGAAA